ncbi:MAG TPA: NAD-dependent protein deacetylase [Chloroflexia bacterium]|nr:NAD-dependent protein deacetylase [Chloroflexia bacterium]
MALAAEQNEHTEGDVEEKVRPLAQALARTQRLVALTGAGISTESGIPDYRSPDGLWSKQAPIYYSDFVRNAAVRRRYWARSLNGYRRFRDASPNTGHYALAAMESAGKLHSLVTQNVDRLHTKAGSRKVVELHGENSTVHCIECSYREPRSQTQERLEWENRHLRLPADETGDAEGVTIPLCPTCGGLIKPGVVFFGEPIPPDLTTRAFEAVDEADALLVVGSSLTVWSGYRLARAAREQGKPLYILNIGPTRADAEATLKVEAAAGESLRSIAAQMGIPAREVLHGSDTGR